MPYLIAALVLHLLLLGIPLRHHVLPPVPEVTAFKANLQAPLSTPAAHPIPPAPPEKQPRLPSPTAKKQIIATETSPATLLPMAPPAENRAIVQEKGEHSSPTPQREQAASPVRFDAAYLKNPPPTYPLASRRQQESGKVLLKVFVNPEGLPVTVDIAQSSHSTRLDEAARQAVSRWRFIPAKIGDRTITAEVIVPIIFKLED